MQEFLRLCQNEDIDCKEFSDFYNQNKHNIPIQNESFVNECLLACCENKNHARMYWIYFTMVANSKNHKTNLQPPHPHVRYDLKNEMFIYMLKLCCEIGNENYFKQMEQRLWSLGDLDATTIKNCYDIAFKNKHFHILILLSKWYPEYVRIFPNFNHYYDFYFTTRTNIQSIYKEQKQKKQLFLLWLTSTHSPNINCFLYQLPREISRYLIEQFVD